MKIVRAVTAGVVLVVVGAAGVAWHGAGYPLPRLAAGAPPAAPTVPAVSTTTVPVDRGEVTERVRVAGTLGFDGTYPLVSQLPAGILTAAARAGSTVKRGEQLYAVSARPAILLYGDTPAWRDFTTGMSDGPDVRALEQNLAALGMDADQAIKVDNHFSRTTKAAIKRWQRARGLPTAQRTGAIGLGQVVFLPGPVRIDQVAVATGASVAPGTVVLSGTSTRRVVIAQVTQAQRYLVQAGDRVLVTLPNTSTPVTGTVNRIGADPGVGSDPVGGVAAAAEQDTTPITVSVRLSARGPAFDQAPVQVAITTAQRRGVLLVPVTALLARPGGGYQIRVSTGTTANAAAADRLVDVAPGLYDDTAGTVEVTGTDLREGMHVEVPTS